MGVAVFSNGNYTQLKEQQKYINSVKLNVKFTPKALSLFNFKKTINSDDCKYDLVYIVKQGDKNTDLKYSLRSVERFCNYRNIYIIGYKPSWVTNVKYIKTIQSTTKWKNATNNILTACKTEEISDNFILMNDDFFAIKPINNWKDNLNVCLGSLETAIERYNKSKRLSNWQNAFKEVFNLLVKLKCKHKYNYEAHVPLIINKKEFLEMYKIKEISDIHNSSNKPFHRRTSYKNLYFTDTPKVIKDVKIPFGRDLTDNYLDYSWLSVFDNVTDNRVRYKKLNAFLEHMFPNKSQYEK